MKASAILHGRIDSNGHQHIYIRISHHGVRTYKATKMKVKPEQLKAGKVIGHPKSKEWNREIETLIIQYQAQALEGFKKKVPKTDFYKYIREAIPNLVREPGTVRYYGSQLVKLMEYCPAVTVDQIDKDWLNGYKRFLIQKGNEQNTVWSSFKFLRGFVRMAYKDKLIDTYPFDNYEFPVYIQNQKDYLTHEEVQKIEKFLHGEIGDLVRQAGTWFLIACYTGLRISDIKAFSKKNVVGDRLVIQVQKTKEMIGLPVSDKLRKWLEQVGYKLGMSENTYNGLIKIVCAAAGINKKISTHSARHTAAMMLMDAGVSQEVVAKVLGQKDLRSTSVYAKVSNKRIDEAMKKLK